ncbi:DUF4113 domain-containing protein [Pseudomonas brenneri]
MGNWFNSASAPTDWGMRREMMSQSYTTVGAD